jgi:hypothetical protein
MKELNRPKELKKKKEKPFQNREEKVQQQKGKRWECSQSGVWLRPKMPHNGHRSLHFG